MLNRIAQAQVIPAIREIDVDSGLALIASLASEGYTAMNISLQSEHGIALLQAAAQRFPSLLMGGGNVQTPDEAESALSAGARFILSPLFHPQMISLVKSSGNLILPVQIEGTLARDAHLEAVSLYPVERCGGIETLRRLWDEFSIRSLVAGALDDGKLKPFLKEKGFLAATGTWMIH